MDTIYQVFEDGLRRGITHQSTSDDKLDGRQITVRERKALNFGSCSYLGLETDPRLIDGVKIAAERFGSQFSSSRAYLSLGLYDALETKLARIFERPAIVGASTTLLHLATLPVAVEADDAVILDQMVHASVQNAAQMLKARGATLEIVRHNRLDQLEKKIVKLSDKHRRVWYLADGVYSMFGDYAPITALVAMMKRHHKLWLYLDDAHGMSWTGLRGSGYVRSQIDHHERMVLTVSLNKSFAAAGGAVVLPSHQMAKRVRTCGPTFIFSGPIQPPMLGACIASAEIHLSDQLPQLQRELSERIDVANKTIEELGLPQIARNDAPLFFIPVGLPRQVSRLVAELQHAGYHANGGAFPAVPMLRGGVRFTVTRHLGTADIRAMLERLHNLYTKLARDEGITPGSLAQAFKCPALAKRDWAATTRQNPRPTARIHPIEAASCTSRQPARGHNDLRLRSQAQLSASDRQRWDELFANRGPMSAAILESIATVFGRLDDDTQHLDLRYLWVEDTRGKTVLATFYVDALIKDDMFECAEISRAIEDLRRSDPMYLTSRALIMGSPVSVGDHLFLDRAHPKWRRALAMMIDELKTTMARGPASRIMLRDFAQGADHELRDAMLENGLFEYRLPDKLVLRALDWQTRAEYLQRLGQKYRYNVRKEILAFEERFTLETLQPQSAADIDQCYQLYCQVHDRAAEINVFRLPREHFSAMCAAPSYDVIRLYLRDDPRAERKPVAVMFGHFTQTRYTALIVGLDYDYLHSHNVYKQILFQTVERARALQCEILNLGFTATLEKKKLGARPQPMCAYVLLEDHFSSEVIRTAI